MRPTLSLKDGPFSLPPVGPVFVGVSCRHGDGKQRPEHSGNGLCCYWGGKNLSKRGIWQIKLHLVHQLFKWIKKFKNFTKFSFCFFCFYLFLAAVTPDFRHCEAIKSIFIQFQANFEEMWELWDTIDNDLDTFTSV